MQRFQSGGYLGLHLTVGMMIALAALWVFAGVTEDVIHGDPLIQFDLRVFNWLHQHTSPLGSRIFEAVGWMASPVLIITTAVLVALVLFLRKNWLLFSAWTATLVGSGIVDASVKHIFKRPRPNSMDVFLYGPGNSFPSGHALGSLVFYGMIAYLLVVFRVKDRGSQIAIVVAAALIVLAIGFSRLYIGVHYFSDILAGYAAGLVWLSTCITAVEVARRQPHPNPEAMPPPEQR